MIRPDTSDPEPGDATRIFADFLRRLEEGRAPDLEAICAQHPRVAGELHALYDDYRNQDLLREGLSTLREPLPLEQAAAPARISSTSKGLSPRTATFIAGLEARSPAAPRYRVEQRIARGGQGEILKVRDEDLDRTLAMKQIRPDRLAHCRLGSPDLLETCVGQFVDEARNTAALNHPGVIPIHDVGLTAEGNVYFTMPEVAGTTLGEIIRQIWKGSEEWTRTRALGVILRVCETMAYAHAQGLLHRDLKPANIMVGAFGETYVMDWGLARPLGHFGTGPGRGRARRPASPRPAAPVRSAAKTTPGPPPEAIGTPVDTVVTREPGTLPYMAPEQAAGRRYKMGPHTDVYAIGAILYELLTGRPPYTNPGGRQAGDPDELRRHVIRSAPEPVAGKGWRIPDELVAICDKAMQRRIVNRYRTMTELAVDLRAYLEGRVVAAFESGPLAQLRKWMKRNKAITAAATVAVLALAAGLAATTVEVIRAHRENTLRKAAEADLALGAVDLARQRGAWPKVLEYVDRARKLGYHDEVALDLRRAEALIATSQDAEASRLLEALLDNPEVGDRRGRVLLSLGECRTAADGDVQAYDDQIRKALEAGLSGADREWALGRLAASAEEALEHYRNAIDLDPADFRAHRDLISLSSVLGDWSQAQAHADVLGLLFPDDPTPTLLRLERLISQRRFDKARELLPDVAGSLPADTVEALQHSINQGEAGTEARTSTDLSRLDGSLLNDVKEIADVNHSLDRWIPVHPAIDACWFETVESVACALLDDWAGAREHALGALKHAPNSLAAYVRAIALFNNPGDRFPDQRSRLLEVARLFDEAASIPTPIPFVARTARLDAAEAYVMLVTRQGLTGERSRAFDRLRFFAHVDDPRPAELARATGLALELPDSPVARQLVDRWEEVAPGDVTMLRQKARLAARGHSYIEAADILWPLLDLEPGDEAIEKEYSDLIEAASNWVKVATDQG